MEKIDPCPFCGGEAKLVKDYSMGGTRYIVSCTKCPCDMGRSRYWKAEDAIRAWNRRENKPKVSIALYDTEEIHEDCTVQILTNSVTGEQSIGWWKNH